MSHFVSRVFRLSYTPPGRRLEDVRRQHGLARTAPGPTDEGTGEDAVRLPLEEQITRPELFGDDADASLGR